MTEPNKPNRRLSTLWIGLVIAVLVLAGCGSALPNPPALQSKITPSPEVSSGAMLHDLRATEDAALSTYGWLDRKSGTVHIPIERAMQLLLQRGLPTRPTDQQPVEEF